MLSRATLSTFSAVKPCAVAASTTLSDPMVQKRFNKARELKDRIKSIKGIQRIANTMKMSATSKLKKAQDYMEYGRAFAQSMHALVPEPENYEHPADKTFLYVPFGSDRGMCGQINVNVLRALRRHIREQGRKGASNFKIFCVGDKPRMGLERQFPKNITYGFSDMMRPRRFNFNQAGMVVDQLLKLNFESGKLMYPRYVNVASFKPDALSIFSKETELANPVFQKFTEDEGGNDLLDNLYEFRMAVRVFHLISETEASEQASRQQSMTGSLKAATDMVARLNMEYNRARQGKITAELCEIVAGIVEK